MGIKTSHECNFHKIDTDHVDHMLIFCLIIIDTWPAVNDCITELGFFDYNLSNSRKILGDLENDPILNSIILPTKKIIYDF